jgi:AcrR family transcriptional regulator
MQQTVGTKQRIVEASADLMARRGYEATGMKEIADNARAPFGSVYHFFPGGKEQLGAEAIRWSGTEFGKLLPAVLAATPDLVTGVRMFFAGAADHLVATDFADACPIATVALEVSSHSEVLRKACADVFDDWVSAGTQHLIAAGVPPGNARRLVIELLAALEGAFILCRATRRTEALDVVGEAAASAVAAAIPPKRRARSRGASS